jgi:glucose-6-phosphate dehydrogenase assembly protein OpcA
MSTATTPAPAWRGEPAALSEVERSLERQYRDHRSEGAPGLVRTRVATLVVIVPDEDQAARALEVIAELPGRNPSRCIVLVVRPEDTDHPGVRAWARVVRRSGRGPGSPRLTGGHGLRDEVVVEATIPRGHLASVVLPLLLPDIPVFTWWPGEVPLGSELAEELLGVTDRLIVDSASFADPVAGLIGLAGAAGALPAPSDCVWGQLTAWRELIAGSFDGLPDGVGPEHIEQVRIAAVQPTAGLLTAGWLAARLGWRAEGLTPGSGPGKGTASFSRPEGGAVSVELRSAVGSGALASVRVLARNPDRPDSPVTLLLEGRGRLLLASRSGGNELAGTRVGHCGMSRAQALGGELELFGRDLVFEQALAATAAWTATGA